VVGVSGISRYHEVNGGVSLVRAIDTLLRFVKQSVGELLCRSTWNARLSASWISVFCVSLVCAEPPAWTLLRARLFRAVVRGLVRELWFYPDSGDL